MKHIRITVRPNLERAPAFLSYLLESPAVNEARAIDWNRADSETTTHLYAIDGNADEFATAASKTPGIESVTLSATDEPTSYALIEIRNRDVPMFGVIEEALAKAGLVVRRPLVYRNGEIHGHVVGEPEMLQAVLDDAPDSIVVQIDEINQFPSGRSNPVSTLSDRQREAIETALDIGYYDVPRQATHEDVGDVLGCAPNTASDHLQKGEAKLVRAGMNKFKFDV